MKTLRWLVVLGLVVPGVLLGMQRATMEAPVVRGTADEITVTARFSSFNAGSEYRVGAGGGSKALEGLKITLDKEGSAMGANLETFGQSQNWWSEAGELDAQGFLLTDSELPGSGEALTLRVTVPRSAAESAGAFYIFVAKRYGPNTWYLEDGAEITEEYW